MCGRYMLATTPSQITLRFDLQGELPEIPPRYNVAPEMTMPVVVSHSPNRLQLMRWGFLPRWAKDPKAVRQPINARSETVAESRMFGRSLRFQRCIVPASGFYEWQKLESRKQPQYITLRSGE